MSGSFDWVGFCVFLVIVAGLAALVRVLPNRPAAVVFKAVLITVIVLLVAVMVWNTTVHLRR